MRKRGIDVVLSGGMAVEIYSSNQYTSRDLDFIRTSPATKGIDEAMASMGFKRVGRSFTHPDSELFVEFPPGPLTVGDEPVKSLKHVKYSTGILTLISPTDCVKDRLSWYYHYGDRQSLDQAVMVARRHRIALAEVRRWSEHEGKLTQFKEIQSQLGRPRRRRTSS